MSCTLCIVDTGGPTLSLPTCMKLIHIYNRWLMLKVPPLQQAHTPTARVACNMGLLFVYPGPTQLHTLLWVQFIVREPCSQDTIRVG